MNQKCNYRNSDGSCDLCGAQNVHDECSTQTELGAIADPHHALTFGPIGVDQPDCKQTNPKDLIGSSKLPIHLWPTTASAMGCIGLLEGMLKYGRTNWREAGVRASIYVDACKRHLDAWFEGEEVAPDSGVPHLANALACLAIIVDAQAAGKLNDDRAYNGAGYRRLVEKLTFHVERLKALHADKAPKHFTIQDHRKGHAGDA